MMLFVLFLHMVYFRPSYEARIEQLLKETDYDKRIRPLAGERPLRVKNQIFVLKLTSINEHDFTYEISYFHRQWWRDPRLASNDTSENVMFNEPPDDLIWLPNLTLVNSDKNERVERNFATHISQQGDIFVSQRMTAKCSCIMDLAFYPMDIQYCPFQLESYAYSTDHVRLEWEEPAVEIKDGLELSGYYLIDALAERTQSNYVVHNTSNYHDNLVLEFVVKRTFLYYLYRAYVPIILLMIFNIGSYWVPDTALAERVTLIVTTFLTNIFILQSVSEETVRVASTTSLQLFLVVNIVFIVVAIIEFFILLQLKETDKLHSIKLPPQPSPQVSERNGFSLSTIMPSDQNSRCGIFEASTQDLRPPKVHRIDRVFRIIAPSTYIIFCVVYFGYYFGKNQLRDR